MERKWCELRIKQQESEKYILRIFCCMFWIVLEGSDGGFKPRIPWSTAVIGCGSALLVMILYLSGGKYISGESRTWAKYPCSQQHSAITFEILEKRLISRSDKPRPASNTSEFLSKESRVYNRSTRATALYSLTSMTFCEADRSVEETYSL